MRLHISNTNTGSAGIINVNIFNVRFTYLLLFCIPVVIISTTFYISWSNTIKNHGMNFVIIELTPDMTWIFDKFHKKWTIFLYYHLNTLGMEYNCTNKDRANHPGHVGCSYSWFALQNICLPLDTRFHIFLTFVHESTLINCLCNGHFKFRIPIFSKFIFWYRIIATIVNFINNFGRT